MVRDGWLPAADDGTCAVSDVRDLEEMEMPKTWRARESRRHRLTPVVTVEDFDRLDWRRVARAYGCNRSTAYRRIKLARCNLL